MSMSTIILISIAVISLGISAYSLVAYIIERQTKTFRSHR
jgi:hypothetical protein